MLKQRARMVSFGLFLLDVSVTVLSLPAAWWIRHDLLEGIFTRRIFPLDRYYPLLPVIVAGFGLSFWFSGLYRSHRTVTLKRELWEVLRAVLAGGLILILYIFMSRRGAVMSRAVIALFLAIDAAALAADRIIVRLVARWARSRNLNYRNIIVVGTDERARNFDDMTRGHSYWGITVLGFIDPDDGRGPPAVDVARIMGRLDDLPRLLQEKVVDEVIFVVSPSRLTALEDTFLLCEELGIRTRVVMEYLPRQLARVYVESFEGVPVLTFTTAPIDATALLVKRLADVVLSALLLVVLAPLLVLIVLAVRLSSSGPVLFRQTRVGLYGRRFTLLKFRSMHRDAEAMKAGLAPLNIMDGPVFKAKDDPRVTGVGRFLRKWSLDELPQLINVFMGDMSFVGPRPPVPDEVSQYQRWQRRRLSMKPGLTCLWQVSGRNDVDFNTWMKMDLDYIDRWSLWLDVKIFLKTIPVVLSRRGAM